MRRLVAGVVLGVLVGSCGGAEAVGDKSPVEVVGETIVTPDRFDDVYTFCVHGTRVFLTETDVQSTSAIAVAPRNGAGGNDC